MEVGGGFIGDGGGEVDKGGCEWRGSRGGGMGGGKGWKGGDGKAEGERWIRRCGR